MLKNKARITTIILMCTMGLGMVSCNEASGDKTYTYSVTEEGVEHKMTNAPISSHWFPNELLEWSSEDDKDSSFNKSMVPLASRVDKDNLYPVNETQNKKTKVVAISIMNENTSGNISQGNNKFASNTFSYWQYIDKLVYWGGSSGEGLIVPPSPDVTDSAHKNGVPVLGTVFFPTIEHGGKMQWLNDFLKKDSNGKFPMVDKLIEVAKTYNFDGWFINQETQGTDSEPLTVEHTTLMQEFIKEFKNKAGENLEIMWYDSMTEDGEIDWQNALTDKNDIFLVDEDKEDVADSMFLNFWWTTKKLMDKELLKASNEKASDLGIDAKELYAGIDMQANGTSTPIRWNLFENGKNDTQTSLGLYCPSWTFFSSNGSDQFEEKEGLLWVNEFKDPSKSTEAKDREWRGVSTYVVERTAVDSLPFTTNFNIGNGYNYFIDGEKVSSLDWNNRSLADIMPTYRWIIENQGENNLKANIDYSTAYYGGNSIRLLGNLEGGKESVIKLFSADLKLEKDVEFTTVAKADSDVSLDLILEFHDGTTETIAGDKKLGKDWTKVTYNVNDFADKNIKNISYQLSSEKTTNVTLNLGNISIDDKTSSKPINIKKLKIDESNFEEEDTLAGVRLSWETSKQDDLKAYEIYRVNKDNTRSFLGATPNNNFFVNSLQRDKEDNETKFEVVAVNKDEIRGKRSTVKMKWPDNSVPKANFKASKTLVAPGEEITFESISNKVTESVEWKFEGANIETSTELNPTVKYEKEGIYNVTLIAKNKKGKDEKVIDGFINVTNKAKDGLINLAINKNTEASSFVNTNESPEFAVDGKLDTKWCAVGPDKHNITIDLGETKTISELHVNHAEAGGESQGMNTEEYRLEVSDDGVNFTTVVDKIKSSSGSTVDAFKTIDARYVKFTVLKATQGSDSAARIYEIGVYGLE